MIDYGDILSKDANKIFHKIGIGQDHIIYLLINDKKNLIEIYKQHESLAIYIPRLEKEIELLESIKCDL